MALPLLAAAAAVPVAAAYLDAKLNIAEDWHWLATSVPAIRWVAKRGLEDRMTTYSVFEDQAKTQPDVLFLIYEGKTWTYKQMFEDINRWGQYFREVCGVQKGEVVAINLMNCPEFFMCWFGLEAIGARAAFLNFNLTGRPLVHCIKIVEVKKMLVDPEILENVETARAEIESLGVDIIVLDETEKSKIPKTYTYMPHSLRAGLKYEDLQHFLFTSGTTGLPKAILYDAGKELLIGRSVSKYLKLKQGERFYSCMPLFHGAPHGLLTTPSIHAGATIVLGHKFSHKTFWPEVRESKATRIQYVGELCRYLLAAPPSPNDKNHSVHMAWGNGVRPDVWEKFRERFGIPIIAELYAATDGLGSFYNWNTGPFGRNAVGKTGLIFDIFRGKDFKLIKLDVDTQEPLTDKNGFCILCKTDEPGELIVRVDPAMQYAQFRGYYKNQEASEKRFTRDVFKKGDMWFRCGDVLRKNKEGEWFFVDRLGDTFRWKSENVSTSEVADVLGTHHQLSEANVYGIQIPNHDGRCGCAAIVFAHGTTEESFDFSGFAKHIRASLAHYAMPLFLRLTPEVATTGNMKQQKVQVRNEGVDPELCKEKVYWLQNGTYKPFRKEEWELLKSGQVRF